VALAHTESSVLDQLDAAVVVTDLSGLIAQWNRAATQLYGWTRDEAVGRNVVDLLVPVSNQEAAGRITEIIVSGQRWEGDFEVRRKDGTGVLVHVSDSLIYDQAGTPTGIIGLSFDITERWRAERRLAVQYGVAQALAEAETLEEAAPKILRTIGANIGWDVTILWRVDARGSVIRCVEVWSTEGLDVSDFERASRATEFLRGVGLPGRILESGQPAWIPDITEDSNFPRASVAAQAGLRSGFGFPIFFHGAVLGIVEAFSPRIQEPEEDLLRLVVATGSQLGQFLERKETEAAVRESEARRGAILEASLDSIVAMDGRGRITEFNPAAQRTFGYTRDEAIGQELAELIIPPSLRERHRAGLAHYLATGEGPMLGKRVELSAIRKDGSEFPIELAITRVDLPGRKLFKGAIRDITEVKRAEDERNHLLESERSAREEAEEARRRLAFLVEANSVLASLLEFAGTLEALGRLAVTLIADI